MQEVSTGVVLAAGGSTRMGQPKALLQLDGRTLCVCHIEAMRPWCRSLRIVLGSESVRIAATLPSDVEVILNRDWPRTTMGDSLRLALDGLDDTELALVSPIDAPPAPTTVLAALVAAGGAAVPTANGRDAHPVVVRVAAARTARTLSDALSGATRVETGWTDGLLNLNTPEQWRAWLRQRGG